MQVNITIYFMYKEESFFVFLFNGILDFTDYLILKPNLGKYYLTHGWGEEAIHGFSKSQEINEIALLEFELPSYEFVVQQVSEHVRKNPK